MIAALGNYLIVDTRGVFKRVGHLRLVLRIKIGVLGLVLLEEPGGCPLIGQAVSGMEAT